MYIDASSFKVFIKSDREFEFFNFDGNSIGVKTFGEDFYADLGNEIISDKRKINIAFNKSFNLGADGYFIKANLTPSQLVENIEKIFGGESVGMKKKPKSAPARKEIKIELATASKGIKILLVEDEEAIISMYELQLNKDGYEVKTARNGAWGLKLAKENKLK